MALTTDQVKHIAKLSRIALSDAEVEKFRTQLSVVLEYIDQLNELDTSKVEPTINTTPITDRMRQDELKTSFTAEEALANTKDKSNNYFVVPNVFGE